MVVCTHRPKSLLDARPTLGRLIELGEENYAMLAKLAPGMASFDRRLVSRIKHGLDLHLEVVEQTARRGNQHVGATVELAFLIVE